MTDPDLDAKGAQAQEAERQKREKQQQNETPQPNGLDFDPPPDFDDRAPPHDDEPGEGVSLADFWAYMPMHNYIFAPSRQLWPASSVNARIPPVPLLDAHGRPKLDKNGEPVTVRASAWLDKNRPVEQMTWAPGEPMIIHDRLTDEGGWITRKGVNCFNLYRPPSIRRVTSAKAGKWIKHILRFTPTTIPISFATSRIGYSAPMKKLTTLSSSAAIKGLARTPCSSL